MPKDYTDCLIISTWMFYVLAQPPYTMCLRVKFYPPDPPALKEEITRYSSLICSLFLFKIYIFIYLAIHNQKELYGNGIWNIVLYKLQKNYNSLKYLWWAQWQFNTSSALFSDTCSSYRLKEICIMADSCAKVQMLLRWPHLFCRVTANHSHSSHFFQYLFNYGIWRALLYTIDVTVRQDSQDISGLV